MKTSVLLLFFLSLSCAEVQEPLDVQGHRGARGLMPENSIPAFMRALKEGVTTLELDVVITSDKQVLVSHDPYMLSSICSKPNGEPVTKDEEKRLNIYQMNHSEVVGYDCGSRGNSRFPEQEKAATAKPLLTDVISMVENHLKENNLPKVGYNIEIKSVESEYNVSQPEVDEFSALVLDVIKQRLTNDRFTIQSFDFNVLKYLHKSNPEVRLVALVENAKGIDANLEALGFIPEVYSPYFILLKKEDIDFIHEKGMKVIPWTVNDRKDMERLVADGVDGIITDYPNLAKGLKK
ncbi:glycerophosphodiester phosphodiesterase family protein [Roseivirga echinicomitans]|uniref:Glycerophosphodiester phosphodiesterase n=1 Tax=Roseivirga echinicomitans TaxID=296218 RepID=A0A150XJM1_9BACT|nr:glycerophosphodiester phosphodiesterase family protein [Roseivirga echinicomitans]KYG78903.1 glycerophosphodiester phosphodiesterase [Roseivirga echinicomitans]